MKHINAIIIGASIIAAAALIVFNLPRYQYVRTTIQRVDSNGSITEDSESYIFDMVSARLYNKSSTYTITDTGQLIYSSQTVGKPPVRSSLKVWKKQYEVFRNRVFTAAEWKEWKKANGWD